MKYIKLFEVSTSTKKLNKELISAIQMHNVEDFERLIKSGANINYKDPKRGFQTPLIIAIRYLSLEMVEELIRLGADVNLKEANGNSPIMNAVMCHDTGNMWKDFPIIDKLIASGADVNCKNLNGVTPLDAIVGNQLRYKIDTKKNINNFDPTNGNNWQSKESNDKIIEVIKILINADADYTIKSPLATKFAANGNILEYQDLDFFDKLTDENKEVIYREFPEKFKEKYKEYEYKRDIKKYNL